MRAHNGHEFLKLYRLIFDDLSVLHPEICSLDRDVLTLEKRFLNEGLSFFTKTLPSFGKAVDRVLSKSSLSAMTLIRLDVPGFHKSGQSGLPAFMRGFLERVFTKEGYLRLDADSNVVKSIRQVCYLLYKLELPYEKTLLDSKIVAFIESDNGLPHSFSGITPRAKSMLARAKAVVTSLFRGFDPRENLIPCHGPGAVADGEKPWEKMDFKVHYAQIARYYPYRTWYFLSPRHLSDEFHKLLDMVHRESGVSRMCFVPKDSRGPRLIAMEPLEYMWIQQALKRKLYDWLESHPLSKGLINFTNQNINRQLALEASCSDEIATLDMKDASDSVSLALVSYLFSKTKLLEALLATRTPDVALPEEYGGGIHHYKKFAPMGSALCFPIEAIVFWSLAVALLAESMPIRLAMRRVYVYGDDIIVDSRFASELQLMFPEFGLKFNSDKCCTGDSFKESCGCDAFRGVEVQPLRIKRLPPENRHDAPALVAYVAYTNEIRNRGYLHASEYMQSLVEGLLGPLPYTTGENQLAWNFNDARANNKSLPRRWNVNLQRREVRAYSTRPKSVISPLKGDWSGPLKALTCGSSNGQPDVHAVQKQLRIRPMWVVDETFTGRLRMVTKTQTK